MGILPVKVVAGGNGRMPNRPALFAGQNRGRTARGHRGGVRTAGGEEQHEAHQDCRSFHRFSPLGVSIRGEPNRTLAKETCLNLAGFTQLEVIFGAKNAPTIWPPSWFTAAHRQHRSGADSMRSSLQIAIAATLFAMAVSAGVHAEQSAAQPKVLFQNVRIFD